MYCTTLFLSSSVALLAFSEFKYDSIFFFPSPIGSQEYDIYTLFDDITSFPSGVLNVFGGLTILTKQFSNIKSTQSFNNSLLNVSLFFFSSSRFFNLVSTSSIFLSYSGSLVFNDPFSNNNLFFSSS